MIFQYSIIEWCGSDVAYAREYFAVYADTCFAIFGDRVKNWITINEPLQTAVNGYDVAIFAPGRRENSLIEPYLAAHHQILAHAAAVSIYRSKYKVQDCTYSFLHKTFYFASWITFTLLLLPLLPIVYFLDFPLIAYFCYFFRSINYQHDFLYFNYLRKLRSKKTLVETIKKKCLSEKVDFDGANGVDRSVYPNPTWL